MQCETCHGAKTLPVSMKLLGAKSSSFGHYRGTFSMLTCPSCKGTGKIKEQVVKAEFYDGYFEVEWECGERSTIYDTRAPEFIQGL